MTALTPPSTSRIGQPVWQLAELFPVQGEWSEREYLALETNYLVEFDDGCVEILPMPTKWHQLIVQELSDQLRTQLGKRNVVSAPYKFRIGPRRYREPDLTHARDTAQLGNDFATAADLVVEVVSGSVGDRRRDFEDKRRDYAAAGVAHYWIVDPETKTLHVLQLDGDAYRDVATVSEGAFDASAVAEGLVIDVEALFSEETS